MYKDIDNFDGKNQEDGELVLMITLSLSTRVLTWSLLLLWNCVTPPDYQNSMVSIEINSNLRVKGKLDPL